MDHRDPPDPPDADLHALLEGVLARTSGPVCGRAHELLADDDPPAVERELLALHLERCHGCRELAAVLAALADDLPGLAEVRPDPAFADDVLAATLPAAVRWRRWWRRIRVESWPRWVRRPRFAWEAAFALTLVLVPTLAAAGSPLRPLGERAMELSRENPLSGRLRLEVPATEAEKRLASAVRSFESSPPVRWTARRVAAAESVVTGLGRRAEILLDEGRSELGTLFEDAASLLTEGEWTPSPEPEETNEVTP